MGKLLRLFNLFLRVLQMLRERGLLWNVGFMSLAISVMLVAADKDDMVLQVGAVSVAAFGLDALLSALHRDEEER